jgi:hypothetical protein
VKLWIVGLYFKPGGWEFLGVFSDQKLAEGVCTTTLHFVASVTLNATENPGEQPFFDAYYPLRLRKT